MSGAFPWRAAMAFGLGTLRLPPPTFWALTPRELAALAGGADEAPDRAALDELMRRFPDERTTR